LLEGEKYFIILVPVLSTSCVSLRSAAFQYNVNPRFLRKSVKNFTSFNDNALSLVQEEVVFTLVITESLEKNSSSSITFNKKVYSSKNNRIIVQSCSRCILLLASPDGGRSKGRTPFESRLILANRSVALLNLQKYLIAGNLTPGCDVDELKEVVEPR
jgi:hypothetical protein